MPLRSFTVPSLALAFLTGACGSPQEQGPQPVTPATAKPQSALPTPRPPRKTNGTPVVLALRRPAPVPGTDWTWLMPENRLVTLAPVQPDGKRALLGPNFFIGPHQALIGLDPTGSFQLATGGEIHPLGKFEQAAFDAQGHNVLAWSSTAWALFSREGKRLYAEATATAQPVILPSGGVVERMGRLTRIISPSGEVRGQIGLRCEDVFPSANRLVCYDREFAKGPQIIVLALDSGAELGRFPVAKGAKPSISARADGNALALAGEKIDVIELAHGGSRASSRTVYRRASGATWRAPRTAFTADGKQLCIEEIDETHVIDPAASEFKNGGPRARAPKDVRPMCLFVTRGPEPAGPGATGLANEWDAVTAQVPLREGYQPVTRSLTARLRTESEAVSFDRKTGALAEQKILEDGESRRFTEQVVVFDMATGAAKKVLQLGEQRTTKWAGPDIPQLELSDDGSQIHVCAGRLIPEGCRVFSTATGETVKAAIWPAPGQTGTLFNVWSGEWPEARAADVLATLGVPEEKGATITSWTDQGRYLSIEMDVGGGASVHLNLPDAPERVVRDVVPLGGGALFGIVIQGVVEIWSVQPLELHAILVGVQSGGAALFADNSVETFGDGGNAIGCQQGETLAPIDACGDVRAEKGTLLGLVKSAAAKK